MNTTKVVNGRNFSIVIMYGRYSKGKAKDFNLGEAGRHHHKYTWERNWWKYMYYIERLGLPGKMAVLADMALLLHNHIRNTTKI